MRISDWSSDVCSSDLIRNWQAGPPRSGILYMQDRSFQWYEVTMSGPCIESHAGPVAVVYTTDNNGTLDRFSNVTFPAFGTQSCGVQRNKTSHPPPRQPGHHNQETNTRLGVPTTQRTQPHT